MLTLGSAGTKSWDIRLNCVEREAKPATGTTTRTTRTVLFCSNDSVTYANLRTV